jgi:hypothetical protein
MIAPFPGNIFLFNYCTIKRIEGLKIVDQTVYIFYLSFYPFFSYETLYDPIWVYSYCTFLSYVLRYSQR